MRKILDTDPIFKMVKMSNHFELFGPVKICYYVQMKLLNNNMTQGFLKI